MKRVLLNVLAGAALAAAPSFAQFEGEIDTKITGQGGFLATQKLFVSKTGMRSEMDMETEGTRRAQLGIDFEGPWPRGRLMPVHMVTLLKFGSPPVMYLIDDEAKTYSEMSLQKTGETASKMTVERAGKEYVFRGVAEDDGAVMKALRDAQADGILVKRITREKGTMELTKAERRSLPASMFEVPSGYRLRPLPSRATQKMTFQERKRLEERKQQQKN